MVSWGTVTIKINMNKLKILYAVLAVLVVIVVVIAMIPCPVEDCSWADKMRAAKAKLLRRKGKKPKDVKKPEDKMTYTELEPEQEDGGVVKEMASPVR